MSVFEFTGLRSADLKYFALGFSSLSSNEAEDAIIIGA